MTLMNRYTPLETRFWANVQKSVDPDGCWWWLGGVGGARNHVYGRIKVNKIKSSAHRVSWELHSGPIPQMMNVCHRCDNTRCVNPAHLFLGTQSDNIRDAEAKGNMVHWKK